MRVVGILGLLKILLKGKESVRPQAEPEGKGEAIARVWEGMAREVCGGYLTFFVVIYILLL